MIDDGQRVLVESVETFTDGFNVVISSSRRQPASHEPCGHGFIADLEVEDEGAWFDCFLELDALSYFTRISINQVALGTLQFGHHGFFQQVQHNVL